VGFPAFFVRHAPCWKERQKENDTVKIRTTIKAGGVSINHNGSHAGVKVRTKIKAGAYWGH
jgi:hypothetical protein